MESLAMLVLILMSTVFLSGPLGIILTTKTVWNYSQEKKILWIIRRIFVSLLSSAGIAISAIFVFTKIPIGPKLVAIGGIALNTFAFKREYFRDK